ncbi:hypothetical protein CEXT_67561, partial [Caerostris extrusa]
AKSTSSPKDPAAKVNHIHNPVEPTADSERRQYNQAVQERKDMNKHMNKIPSFGL